jgi:hypothetical protein
LQCMQTVLQKPAGKQIMHFTVNDNQFPEDLYALQIVCCCSLGVQFVEKAIGTELVAW